MGLKLSELVTAHRGGLWGTPCLFAYQNLEAGPAWEGQGSSAEAWPDHRVQKGQLWEVGRTDLPT